MVDNMSHVVTHLQNDVLTTLRNFSDLVSQGQRISNLAVSRWFRSFGTRLEGDIHTWKVGPIAKEGPHGSCGPPFAKRRFGNSSKLLWLSQPRPQAPKSCCFGLIPIVWHSIGTRYPHLEIRPSSKGGVDTRFIGMTYSQVFLKHFCNLNYT